MTQDELKSRLHYDPETGVFTWLPSLNRDAQWHSVFMGKPAGTIIDTGYIRIRIDDKGYRAHRLAWLYMHGELPEEIDHIDGDKTNNAINNLRSVTHSENLRNTKKNTRNTTGVVGVTHRKKRNKWLAYITVNRKRIHGGIFDTMDEAVEARRKLEEKYDFHENHGR